MKQTALIHSPINEWDDRKAMGLSDSFTALRYEDIALEYASLQQYSNFELANVVENVGFTLKVRYAAGMLLGLLGDPRIQVLQPAMVSIGGGTHQFGLMREALDTVSSQYADLGVLREWIEKEVPRFTAGLAAYNMGKYPVTNQEYYAFLCDEPSNELPSSWEFGRYPAQRSNHPVYTLSPQAAQAYTQWIAKKTGRRFRLPTEIEWEYAAAGPLQNEFPWGNEYLEDHANTAEFRCFATTPVGMFGEGASCFGLLDMAGNVEEYTSDDYWVYPGGRFVSDDLTRGGNSYRIARGGSFTRFKDLARCKRRHGRYAKHIYVMGFRLAETAP